MKNLFMGGLPCLFLIFLLLSHQDVLAQVEKGKEYQKSVDQIGREMSKISKNLNANKTLLKNERDTLGELEQKIELIRRQQRASSKSIKYYLENIGRLNQKEIQLNSQHEENRKALSLLVRARFLEGEPNYLKMVLNQENPYAVGRLNNYYSYFSKSQQNKIQEIQQEISQMKALRFDKKAELEKLEQERSQQKEQSKELEDTRALRKASIAKLSKKVSVSGEKLKNLERDRKRLNSLIRQVAIQAEKLKKLEQKRLQNEQKRIQQGLPSAKTDILRLLVKGGFVKQKGRLSHPVKAPLKYRFGDRIVESGMRAQGLFFQTGESLEVKSIFRGRVLFADYLKGYGVLLIIDHGDDHISLYGHNEVIYKNVGEMVETNEIISKSGVSGGLQSAGLYFEIRKNTSPVNPLAWFQ